MVTRDAGREKGFSIRHASSIVRQLIEMDVFCRIEYTDNYTSLVTTIRLSSCMIHLQFGNA